MPLVGFEPTISAGKQPQTYALDRAASLQERYIYIYNMHVLYKVPVIFLRFYANLNFQQISH